MKYEVIASSLFERRLAKAIEFLQSSPEAERSVPKLFQELSDKFEVLGNYPRVFSIDEEISRRSKREVRRAAVSHFLLFYEIDGDAMEVRLLTLRHQKESPDIYYLVE